MEETQGPELQSLVGLGLNNGTGSNCAGKLLGVLSKGVIYEHLRFPGLAWLQCIKQAAAESERKAGAQWRGDYMVQEGEDGESGQDRGSVGGERCLGDECTVQ